MGPLIKFVIWDGFSQPDDVIFNNKSFFRLIFFFFHQNLKYNEDKKIIIFIFSSKPPFLKPVRFYRALNSKRQFFVIIKKIYISL